MHGPHAIMKVQPNLAPTMPDHAECVVFTFPDIVLCVHKQLPASGYTVANSCLQLQTFTLWNTQHLLKTSRPK